MVEMLIQRLVQPAKSKIQRREIFGIQKNTKSEQKIGLLHRRSNKKLYYYWSSKTHTGQPHSLSHCRLETSAQILHKGGVCDMLMFLSHGAHPSTTRPT